MPLYRCDVLVIGSGVAGACAALAAAENGAGVSVVAKSGLAETNTRHAQGGMAAVLGPDDSFAAHVADTVALGLGLCDLEVVERVVRGGPQAVQRLVELGAHFDKRPNGTIDLLREGGHSHGRIVHAGGASTGLEIQRALEASVRGHPDITTFERAFAVDLLTGAGGRALGALVQTERGERALFAASEVILATGGAGQIYRETTNPTIATGDGVAMAFRAGAELRDLEFFQFHPTCLYIAGAARVLISEVVRGEGGVLRDKSGIRFMPEYHPDAELAPRDVVSRACFQRMVSTGDTSVYLDLSGLDRDPHRLFPAISRICRHFSIDIASDPIPVRPGAHYMIGGVRVDHDGRTSVAGLWAVGECANSGMHGANRMGSNSLLEGLVLGERAGLLAATAARGRHASLFEEPMGVARREPPQDVQLNVQDLTYSLKSLMWRQMGIERAGPSIEDAIEKLRFWTRALGGLLVPEVPSWELLNMLTVAHLAALGALERRESRGTHHRSDFQALDPAWHAHTTFRPILDRGEHGQCVAGVDLRREPVADSALV